MPRTRFSAALYLLLVFASGILVGAVSQRLYSTSAASANTAPRTAEEWRKHYLAEMKQKVNWLIASFYDQGKKDQDVRDRLDRLEAGMASLSDMMRKMCESQAQWRSSMDQVVEILVRARTSAAAQ